VDDDHDFHDDNFDNLNNLNDDFNDDNFDNFDNDDDEKSNVYRCSSAKQWLQVNRSASAINLLRKNKLPRRVLEQPSRLHVKLPYKFVF
jgi:hypothetical protein